MNAADSVGEWLRRRGRIAAGAAITLLAVATTAVPAFDRFHGLDIDILHALGARLAPVGAAGRDNPVAVIAIDEATYRMPPFDTLPRVLWTPQIAAVQDAVLAAGATVFAWDVVLSTSASTYVADPRYDAPLLRSLSRHGRGEGRVILGEVTLGEEGLRPFVAFRRAAGDSANLRSLNVYTDPDGIVRGVPLTLTYSRGGKRTRRPGIAFEVALRHAGETFEAAPGAPVRFAGRPVPVFSGDNLIVRFDGTAGAIPTYSFADLVRCIEGGRTDYFEDHFAGRAVFLGAVLDVEDRKLASDRFVRKPDFAGAPTPCAGERQAPGAVTRNTTPGVYIHATAATNLIQGSAVVRAGTAARLALTTLLAVVGAIAAMRWRPQAGLIVLGAAGSALGLVAALAFGHGVEVPLLDPLMGGMLAFGGSVGFRVVVGDRDRRRLHETFKRYLDPKVIEAMLDSGDVPALGGESRELTCFFSDIEKFSSISENLDSRALVDFLNAYFRIAGRAVEEAGGIIERFEGDAILAVFGAPVRDPDHAFHAVQAALAMQEGLRRAEKNGEFALPSGHAVRTRIGINTGTMTAGNVGSERRLNYTVIGDAVNLAARLEGANKQFGTATMAGEETVAAAGDAFEWMEVDRVQVVGRVQPVRVFCPLGRKGTVATGALRVRDSYEAALALYRERRFTEALAAFEVLAAEGCAPAVKAAERCRECIGNPPDDGWNGVTVLASK